MRKATTHERQDRGVFAGLEELGLARPFAAKNTNVLGYDDPISGEIDLSIVAAACSELSIESGGARLA